MKINQILKQFNWRFLLVRILVNAIAVAITAAVTPKIYFVDKTVLSWLIIAVVLGILNALLKPILQFLTLRFIFVTYGLVVVAVNTLILLLLSYLFDERFAVDNLLWALVGGLVLGLLSSFLESLLGLTMPIVPEEATALRRQLEEEERHIHPIAAARRESALEKQALAMEPPAPDATAAEPAVAEPAVGEPAVAEPSTAVPDEEPPPKVVEAEAADAAVPAEPEPAPDPGEKQEEDGS